MAEVTDEQLMKQLQKGRSEALDELYRRYSRKLYVFCATALSSQNAEDLVHDVFLRVVESAHQFDPRRAPLGTWLFSIARNRAIDLLRREKKITVTSLSGKATHGRGESAGPLEELLSDGTPDTVAAVSSAELVSAVRSCLGELSKDEERESLVLYYVSGLLFREIGAVFGKSTSMAQKWVRAAREKVKRCLERKGIEP